MKKLALIQALLFTLFVLLSTNVQTQPANSTNAQTQQPAKDYYVGKWDVLLEGLPQGDPRMIVSLQRKDGKLAGNVLDSAQNEIAKITKVEETEKSVTIYFTAQEYDVNLEITKKDEDHVTVSLLGMFDGKGVRIKETKKAK